MRTFLELALWPIRFASLSQRDQQALPVMASSKPSHLLAWPSALLGIVLLAQSVIAVAEDSAKPEQYNLIAQVLPDSQAIGQPQRLRLSLPIMQAFLQPDQQDIRLFDSKGQSLPIQRVTPLEPARSENHPLQVLTPSLNNQWVFRVDDQSRPQRLALQWMTQTVETQATVEGSDDQQSWTTLGQQPISQHLRNNELRNTVDLLGAPVRWLRVTTSQRIKLLSATYTALELPRPLSQPQPTDFRIQDGKLWLDVQSDLPITSIGFGNLPAEANIWQLEGTNSRGQLVVQRPLAPGRQVIMFDRPQAARYWQIRLPSGQAMPGALSAVINWTQLDLWFQPQTNESLTLAVGNADATPPVPLYRPHQALPEVETEATLGAIVRTRPEPNVWRRWLPWVAALVVLGLILRVWLGNIQVIGTGREAV